MLYFWGGDSWDHQNATPKQTGDLFSVAYRLKSPAEEWQRLERNPADDFDAVHGDGKWESLGIDSATLTVGARVLERGGHHIEGCMDELRLIHPTRSR